MKRYYMVDIIGSGTDDDPYRPALDFAGIRYAGVIPSNPDGTPASTWALCIVAAKDHNMLRNDSRIDALPDFPMDGKVSAINNATKGLMKAALTRRNLNANTLVEDKDGYRDVIRGIGRALEPAFSEDKFDVADVT
jgi:hypothetical protein